jgi:hypothetical protein
MHSSLRLIELSNVVCHATGNRRTSPALVTVFFLSQHNSILYEILCAPAHRRTQYNFIVYCTPSKIGNNAIEGLLCWGAMRCKRVAPVEGPEVTVAAKLMYDSAR